MTRTIFLVTNAPTPYRLPLYNEVAHQLREKGLSLKVLFGVSGYARREWEVNWGSANFEYEVLGGRVLHVGAKEFYLFMYPGLLRRIRSERPAAVIVGGYSPATILVRLCRKFSRTPFIIWSGEIQSRSWLRDSVRRWLVAGASAFIAYGSAAKQHLELLGADPNRVAVAINTVDTRFFGAQFAQRSNGQEKSLPHLLVCVSGLVERKQIDALIRVAQHLLSRRNDFQVVIIGNGPDRAKLEAYARHLEVSDVVTFAGFQQRGEIARTLANARCFLFPTAFDIWGLVLVEAMAAGVPCIASIKAGATKDLIENGKTGYAVDFSDTAAVCGHIERLLDQPEHASAVGAAAHALVTNRASLAASAQGFVRALEFVFPDMPKADLATLHRLA
jgi:glycosyltransferase involved in cell wall biosynthesis